MDKLRAYIEETIDITGPISSIIGKEALIDAEYRPVEIIIPDGFTGYISDAGWLIFGAPKQMSLETKPQLRYEITENHSFIVYFRRVDEKHYGDTKSIIFNFNEI